MTDLLPPTTPARPVAGRFWGLVPCAGTGTRAVRRGGQDGSPVLPKQYHTVAGHPMVLHTLAAFAGPRAPTRCWRPQVGHGRAF